MPSQQQGFTLIELMIGLIILSVMVGLAVPAFGDAIERRKIAGVIDDVMTRIALARSEAIKRNQIVSFTVRGDDDENWCIGLRSDTVDPCDCRPAIADPAAVTDCAIGAAQSVLGGRPVAGISLDVAKADTAYNSTPATFSFDPVQGTLSDLTDVGSPGDNQMQFTSAKGNYILAININPLGLPKACFSQVPASPKRYGGLSEC